MAHIKSCLLIAVSALFAQLSIVSAQLVIVEAGSFARGTDNAEITIPSGRVFSFCPASFSKRGFTIECRGRGIKPPVSFFLDGKLYRVEKSVPYSLGGDIGMKRYPWSPTYPLPKTVTVSCFSAKATPYLLQTAVIHFTCPVKTPSPHPTANPFTHSIRAGCVVINAEEYLNKLAMGWTHERTGGLTYGKGDSSNAISAAGSSTLIYTFSVPVKARYAFTVDMTTRGATPNNGVYLQFMYNGGFLLTKEDDFKIGGDGFIQAYNKRNRRATEAYAVENNPHSFSTNAVLFPGVEYYFAVGGRSTQVTVHRIVMFPCASSECSEFDLYMGQCASSKCSAADDYWNNMVQTCT